MVNQLAVRLGSGLNAGVAFYGRQPGAADVPKIAAPLMLHYAGADTGTNVGIPAFEAALKENKKKYELFMYEGKQHGFRGRHHPALRRRSRQARMGAYPRVFQEKSQVIGFFLLSYFFSS